MAPWEPTLQWKVFTTVTYFVVSAGLLKVLQKHIPDIDTRSEIYRIAYFRGKDNYNTTWVSPANLIWYCCNNIAGFIYVNVSNLNCAGSPF